MDASSYQRIERLLKRDTEGEYTIERELGKGGMAVVYLATENRLGRKVAIKVLPPELTFGHGIERFLREARTAAALDHPNIIPIHRISSGDELFWYAMKFIAGRGLDQLLEERARLTLEETVEILSQVADALEYAHEHRVIHRDIKPANVMIDSRGRVVVTDFGIAKALTDGTLTATGSFVGTPHYMSPEQWMGETVTPAADQYSVAVMAYRMLSGRAPFGGNSVFDIQHKHCQVPPPPLDVLCPNIPGHVFRAVHKALEKKPEDRLSSVMAFVQALTRPSPETEGYVYSQEIVETRRPQTGSAKPVPRRRTRIAAIAFIAVIGLVGAAWVLTRGPALATVIICCVPPDGVLLVNGQPATPPLELAPGTYELQLVVRGFETQFDTIQVAAGEYLERNFPPGERIRSVLVVTGVPSTGVLLVDGDTAQSPVPLLPGLPHSLELQVDGYVTQYDTVTMILGTDQTFSFAPVAPDTATLWVMLGGLVTVEIDGQNHGWQSSRYRVRLASGEHRVRLLQDTSVFMDQLVTLAAGETKVLRRPD